MTKPNKKPGKIKPAKDSKIVPASPTFTFKPFHYYTGLILALFAFTIYFNTYRNGYVLDDYSAITINHYVQEGFAGIPKLMTVDFWHFSNLKLGYYRPLSLVTFAIEYQFFGASPLVSHLMNVFFFSLTVFFVFLLMVRLFPSRNLLFPLAIALLFAAHPIHTEVVDNIKGRDELLSFFNVILMLFFSIRYADHRKRQDLWFGMLFFYFGLLSKESAMTGLLLLPLVFYYLWRGSTLDLLKRTAPFAGVLLLFFIQRRWALGSDPARIPIDLINYPYKDESVRYSTAFLLFLFGLKMLFVPWPLRYDYSYNQIPAVTWTDPLALTGFVLFLVMVVLTVIFIKKRRESGLALGFYLVTLAPMMGFIFLRGGIFTERNLFAPSLGICMVIVILLYQIFRTVLASDQPDRSWWSFFGLMPSIIVLAVVGIFLVITVNRNRAWTDSLTLFSTDIKTGERSAQNQLHYGSDLIIKANTVKDTTMKSKMIDQGMSAIRKALVIHPSFGDAMYRYAYGYEVKLTYRPEKRYLDSAIYFFNQATEFAPTLGDAYRHLGILYEWIQRFDVASYYYNKAFAINPRLLEAKGKADEIRKKYGLDVRSNPLVPGAGQGSRIKY